MVKSKYIRACLTLLVAMCLLFLHKESSAWSFTAGGKFLDASVKSSSSSSSSRSSSSSSGSSSSKSSSSSSGSYGSSVSKPSSSSSGSSGSSVAKPPPSSSGGYGSSVTQPASKSTENIGTQGSKPSTSGYGSSVGTGSKGKEDSVSTAQNGKPNANPGERTATAPKTALQQKIDRAYSKQESAKALESYKAEQNKFKMGANSSTPAGDGERAAVNNIKSRVTYRSEGDYYNRREGFYASSGWTPPGYIYRSYNSFGVWDGMMLWFMLDHISDSQYRNFYYHHQDDPGVKQFRQELDKMAAENSELKAKVAKLDAETKELEAQGVKVDPTYIPADAADVVLAADIAKKEIPVKKGSGFPWFWTMAIVAGAGLGFVYLKKRRS
jgi:hypothetical protein